MAARIMQGAELPEDADSWASTYQIGEEIPRTTRVITVELDGDELEAFKWGMTNYEKPVPPQTFHTYITPAGWICTCGKSQTFPTGSSANLNGHRHQRNDHNGQAEIHDTRLIKS